MSICIWLLSISIIMVNISMLKLSKRIDKLEEDLNILYWNEFKRYVKGSDKE